MRCMTHKVDNFEHESNKFTSSSSIFQQIFKPRSLHAFLLKNKMPKALISNKAEQLTVKKTKRKGTDLTTITIERHGNVRI